MVQKVHFCQEMYKGNNKQKKNTQSNLPKGKAKLISKQADKIIQQPENWENV